MFHAYFFAEKIKMDRKTAHSCSVVQFTNHFLKSLILVGVFEHRMFVFVLMLMQQITQNCIYLRHTVNSTER